MNIFGIYLRSGNTVTIACKYNTIEELLNAINTEPFIIGKSKCEWIDGDDHYELENIIIKCSEIESVNW